MHHISRNKDHIKWLLTTTKALVAGRGSVGSTDPTIFERKKGKIMRFFVEHTDPTLKKNWTPPVSKCRRPIVLLTTNEISFQECHICVIEINSANYALPKTWNGKWHKFTDQAAIVLCYDTCVDHSTNYSCWCVS